MNLSKITGWLGKAFSDQHGPSSSRVISAWLSVSSMALIWFIARHMMWQSADKLQIWASNFPLIIGALATFSTAPYGIGRLSEMFKKAGDKVASVEEHKEDNK